MAEFERALAEKVGAKHAVAVCNGTAALHASCLALGVKPGDHVWTSPISFVASANCARYCGAHIGFVDIDPKTRLMSVDALWQKLLQARDDDCLPRMVIPVHFAGHSCDMAAIHDLAETFRFAVLEDAAHAIGSLYNEQPVGACAHSDACTFSFHPVKTLTTAEGGAITTNDDAIAARLRQYITHGITRDESAMQLPNEGAWFYEQQMLGYNFRLSDLHAALGVSQLKRLDSFVEARRKMWNRYNEAFADLPLGLPVESSNTQSAWHLYVVTLESETLDRRDVFDALRSANIGVNVHYIPIHLQPDFRALGFSEGDFPLSEAYYKHALSLPLFPGLSDEQQQYVIDTVKEIVK